MEPSPPLQACAFKSVRRMQYACAGRHIRPRRPNTRADDSLQHSRLAFHGLCRGRRQYGLSSRRARRRRGRRKADGGSSGGSLSGHNAATTVDSPGDATTPCHRRLLEGRDLRDVDGSPLFAHGDHPAHLAFRVPADTCGTADGDRDLMTKLFLSQRRFYREPLPPWTAAGRPAGLQSPFKMWSGSPRNSKCIVSRSRS
jgi:hypothetical protein